MHRETIYRDAEAYFEDVLHDVRNAQRSVDVQVYAFYRDSLGKRVAQALIDAAERGVRVRLMVDGAGTRVWGGHFVERLEQAGVETRIFHPFPWRLWQWGRAGGTQHMRQRWFHLWRSINQRNHRKFFWVDQCKVYLGSFNVDQRHLPRSAGGLAWRDTGLALEGDGLENLDHLFAYGWRPALQQRVHQWFDQFNPNDPIRLNDGRHRRRLLYKNLLRRVAKAKTRVWVTNAYFVPDRLLLKKLQDVAARGCDVRILLPRQSDINFMPAASKTFYQSLLGAGVRIFEYLPSMLHAKTLIVDDWVTVGSSNMNHRSLLHDLEIDAVVRQPGAIAQVVEHFIHDLHEAEEISADHLQQHPLMERVLGQVCLYLRYLI